jgi:tetratricopeptide (TPR) repeat protein
MNEPRRVPHTEFLTSAQLLLTRGDFDEAIRIASARIQTEPEFTEARFLLAFALVRKSRYHEAVVQLEEVVRVQPARKESLYALAVALQGADRKESALEVLETFLKFHPGIVPVLLEAANLALRLGKSDSARQYSTALTEVAPNTVEGWFLLGSALALEDRLLDSNHAFERALRLAPADGGCRLALFGNLVQLDCNREAANLIRQGCELEPENSEYLSLLGSALASLGQEEEAEASFLRAAELEPRTVGSYATFLQERGRFAEAQTLLESSLETRPEQGMAYYQLTEFRSFSLRGEPLVIPAQELLAKQDLSLEERMYLHYALFRCHEADGAFAPAMNSLQEANQSAYAMHIVGREWNQQEELKAVERRMERFSHHRVRSSVRQATTSLKPVIVAGMIRSGTTLLDQILSSHPDVSSAGEQKYWGLAADRWSRSGADFSPTALRELAENYEARLEAFSKGGRVTDKMPLNYHHLGLIHLAVPQAKIVHIRRNPLDTGFSIYSTYVGRGPRWAYSQANIVDNYRLYLRLMEHWRQVIPSESLLEVDYEDLVGSPESCIRSILEFCALPWSDACLHPESSSDAIKTPSRWQARQPIHTGSVKRYERFLPYLGELRGLLA